MKLKLLFCKCVKKLVESYNEGMTIDSIESLVLNEDLPAFLVERMDKALKTVADKVLTHKSITITGHEEAIKDIELKADTTGFTSLFKAIEKTGLKCLEVVSLIELKDILIESEKTDSVTFKELEAHEVQNVSNVVPFDALKELNKFQPISLHEKTQLQPGDVMKTEV